VEKEEDADDDGAAAHSGTLDTYLMINNRITESQ
jgi:hypothetical protein